MCKFSTAQSGCISRILLFYGQSLPPCEKNYSVVVKYYPL